MKLLVVLLLSAAAFAQSAQVAELTPGEHQDATALYQAKEKADAAWDKFATGLAAKYGKPWNVSSVELDKDFRFVVPKATPTSGTCCSSFTYPCWTGSTFTASPVSDGNLTIHY